MPLIGITPLYNEEKQMTQMNSTYIQAITKAGGTPFIFPMTENMSVLEKLVEMSDGILFTGGPDIDPHEYGEEVFNETVFCSPTRDRLEKNIFDLSLKYNKRILGICRGCQVINVWLGGTLYQDIPSQYDTIIAHSQSEPYNIPAHSVNVEKESVLYDTLKKEKIMVTSRHHQAVKVLAPSLQIMARAEDGIIEAFCMPEKEFLWCVQWHPESIYDEDQPSRDLFIQFVNP